jgi:hypothetical protein
MLTPRFSNSVRILAILPSSVVQTGVKSAGCEKRMVQLLPMNSWKSTSPIVVLALKLGAVGLFQLRTNEILTVEYPESRAEDEVALLLWKAIVGFVHWQGRRIAALVLLATRLWRGLSLVAATLTVYLLGILGLGLLVF